MATEPVLKTPDPLITQEQAVAFAAMLLTNVILLFKLNVDDAQRGAILGLVNTAYVIFVLVHAAWVRYGRSRALLNPPRAVENDVIPIELIAALPDGDDRQVAKAPAAKRKGTTGG